MRALAFSLLFACGPKVNTSSTFDEDVAHQEKVAAQAKAADDTQPVVTRTGPGCGGAHGVRTGTIDRARLVAVLDQGPGMFLRQFEVAPRLDGNRFVGWTMVQLIDQGSPLAGVDVAACDVLLAVNGMPLSQPDQLQALWDSLRGSNELVASLARGSEKLELRFAIEPPVSKQRR